MRTAHHPVHSDHSARSVTTMWLQWLTLAVAAMVVHGNMGDHGGVPMGRVNVCDDAKTRIAIDYDPTSTAEYTCDGGTLHPTAPKIDSSCVEKPEEGIHVCYPAAIHYTDTPPTSGRHRPNWPVYGEYTYVPPQRWLHSLEHGAVVMLYHPCADPDQVSALRTVVTRCLRKHVITPYKLLPRETPFALLTWGCKLLMSSVHNATATNFIKTHAKHAPEGNVAGDGNYDTLLVTQAEVVSDYSDSQICPLHPANEKKENPIVAQSQKRREALSRQAEDLDHKVKRLITAYRRLVAH